MRKLLTAMGILACVALVGCDSGKKEPQQQTAIAPPPRTTAAAPARATPPAPPTPQHRPATAAQAGQPASKTARHARRAHARRHYVRRRYAYRHHRYDGHRWVAERSLDIYAYTSRSRSYRKGHGPASGPAAGSTHVWTDGYGRRHLYDQSAVRYYSYQARQRAAQTPERLDPWHGYNDDWDW